MTVPFNLNTNQTIDPSVYGTSGAGAGGTAFNIGGINLGTQYPTAATAGGSSPPGVGGISTVDWLIGGAAVFALALVLIWRR